MLAGTFVRTVLILTLAALAVSGCGRRGALERPTGPAAEVAPAADPGAVNPQAPQKRFILDPLID